MNATPIRGPGMTSAVCNAMLRPRASAPPSDRRYTHEQPAECDFKRYKDRNRLECVFNRLKQFRRITTQYGKTAKSYPAFLSLAAAKLWLPNFVNTP